MRRGVGIGGVARHKVAVKNFSDKGAEIEQMQLETVTTQMASFKDRLETFASSYRSRIRKNHEFRRRFQQMCGTIGVDPLASQKGFWSQLLGVGDFYYELAVQASEICLAARDSTGGLIPLSQLTLRLRRKRGKNANEISEDDVERAIRTMSVLGGGFGVIQLGSTKIVRSVPGELNRDANEVFSLVNERDQGVTCEQLMETHQWTAERAQSVLNDLVKEGIAWIDEQDTVTSYWIPGITQSQIE